MPKRADALIYPLSQAHNSRVTRYWLLFQPTGPVSIACTVELFKVHYSFDQSSRTRGGTLHVQVQALPVTFYHYNFTCAVLVLILFCLSSLQRQIKTGFIIRGRIRKYLECRWLCCKYHNYYIS